MENIEQLRVSHCMNEVFKLRIALGLDQISFAKELSVDQSCISHWESEARSPSGKNLIKLLRLARKHGIEFDLNYFIE